MSAGPRSLRFGNACMNWRRSLRIFSAWGRRTPEPKPSTTTTTSSANRHAASASSSAYRLTRMQLRRTSYTRHGLAAAGKIGSSTAFSPLLGSRDVPGCSIMGLQWILFLLLLSSKRGRTHSLTKAISRKISPQEREELIAQLSAWIASSSQFAKPGREEPLVTLRACDVPEATCLPASV